MLVMVTTAAMAVGGNGCGKLLCMFGIARSGAFACAVPRRSCPPASLWFHVEQGVWREFCEKGDDDDDDAATDDPHRCLG